MSILDSLPATFAAALGDVFRPATLTKTTGRTSDGQGGFTNTITAYTCKALVTDYTTFQRGQLGIPANERKILILAGSVASAAIPVPGDTLTIQGRTWSIIEVASDPANATYEARSR